MGIGPSTPDTPQPGQPGEGQPNYPQYPQMPQHPYGYPYPPPYPPPRPTNGMAIAGIVLGWVGVGILAAILLGSAIYYISM